MISGIKIIKVIVKKPTSVNLFAECDYLFVF